MPAMNTDWKLSTAPESEVLVDTDVLAMRSPLVRVHRDAKGTWSFDGPGQRPRPNKTAMLSAVVGAWPHVAALSGMGTGGAAVWSWTAAISPPRTSRSRRTGPEPPVVGARRRLPDRPGAPDRVARSGRRSAR